jgi:hypothetical protein
VLKFGKGVAASWSVCLIILTLEHFEGGRRPSKWQGSRFREGAEDAPGSPMRAGRGEVMRSREQARRLWAGFWVGLIALLPVAAMAGSEPSTPAGEPGAWRRLFNGKDLEGWYLFLQKYGRDNDPEKVVTVENGELHIYKDARNGDEVVMGYIGTKESLSDYHLRLHYRWGRKQFKPRFLYKPDAGIYYHHVSEDLVWPQALQFQVELNDVGDLLTVGAIKIDTTIDPKTQTEEWQEYLPADRGGRPYSTVGRGVTYTRRSENFERDGWNTLELICKGDEAVQVVNGHVVNRCSKIRQRDTTDAAKESWVPLTGGRILLEFEATEIFYRDIEIRNLASDESLDQALQQVER